MKTPTSLRRRAAGFTLIETLAAVSIAGVLASIAYPTFEAPIQRARRTDAHYQLDVNYTQDFAIGGPFDIQVRLDIFNVFDRQTGYNIQPRRHSAGFGNPRTFYDPRRIQLALTLLF